MLGVTYRVMRTIKRIEADKVEFTIRKRVAAYARISYDPGHDSTSLSNQISHYSKVIQSNPAWEYAGVYSDDGISGLSTCNRTGFLRLMEDADKGLIDIILTKSISRFARNTVDLLNTIRHLSENGISVRFEKEGIDTSSTDGELLLTLLASFAQEESMSLSLNHQWAIERKYRQGIVIHNDLFGYRKDGKTLSLEPDEAKVVRRIFDEYLAGKPTSHIIRDLRHDGILTRRGNLFCGTSVLKILHNERYTGNTVLGKTFTEDPLNGRSVINRGQRTRYYVTDTNPAIVTVEEFEKVQAMLSENAALRSYGRNCRPKRLFSRRIRCVHCGSWYGRGQMRSKEKYWKCGLALKRGQHCCPDAGFVRENDMIAMTMKVLEADEVTDGLLEDQIELIEGFGNGEFIFHLRDKGVVRAHV